MYFLYSLGVVTFNKCLITLSILIFYSPNFQGLILVKNTLISQVGMLGEIFLWLVVKQACGNDIMACVYLCRGKLYPYFVWLLRKSTYTAIHFRFTLSYASQTFLASFFRPCFSTTYMAYVPN